METGTLGSVGVDVDFVFELVFLPIQIAPTLWLGLLSLKCGPPRPANDGMQFQ